MLHTGQEEIRKRLLKGHFGLEKESLRVNGDGYMVSTPHPFPNDRHIVRDFSENQTEINTPVTESAAEAVASLDGYYRYMQKTLKQQPEREYLWPFSNPPYIRNEEEIPIAQFTGAQAGKTVYREYLSHRYGRYKMTFSGIHFNYSFDEELLRKDFELSEESDYRKYKDTFYLQLAAKAALHGWLLVAVTAASPLLDGSFVEAGGFDEDLFQGMASVRCSELGYWNYFIPLFDYSSVQAYANSIQQYVNEGLLRAPSELYYPIRLKPPGENTLENLKARGVDHIELRMFDLNPLAPCGIEEKDVVFAQLFLAWLASLPPQELTHSKQVEAVRNFKNAAHYDLKTVKIMASDGEFHTMVTAARQMLAEMQSFYTDFPQEAQEVLQFESNKFTDAANRYAWKVREQFGDGYVKKGLELAKRRQEDIILVKEAL